MTTLLERPTRRTRKIGLAALGVVLLMFTAVNPMALADEAPSADAADEQVQTQQEEPAPEPEPEPAPEPEPEPQPEPPPNPEAATAGGQGGADERTDSADSLGTSAAPLQQPEVCPFLDGKYEIDTGWEGAPAPGITVTASSDQQVVFEVAEGFVLMEICVKTGNGVNAGDHSVSPTPPVAGPTTVTVTSSGGQGAGLSHITFRVDVKDVEDEKKKPTIETFPEPDEIVVGGDIRDRAVLHGASDPTGTITFELFGPGDATCSRAPLFTDTVPVVDSGAVSGFYTTVQAGVHRWIATYSGDERHEGAVSGCQEELVAVKRAQPSVVTTPIPDTARVGDSIHDLAEITGGFNPTGTVTFQLFPPGDTTCAGPPVFTDTAPVIAGTATSGSYVVTEIGTYRWVADYSGDDNNERAKSGCQEELVVVNPAQPTITTQPVPESGTVGTSIHDTATVTGGFNPTGTVTFQLFPPGDDECDGPPVFTDTAPLVDGEATSASFTATEVGTYRWIAIYSGDDKNESAMSGCQEELVLIVDIAAAPLISVVKTNDANRDGTFTDRERGEPGAAVEFRAVIRNPGTVPVVLDSITDSYNGVVIDVCGHLIGTVLAPGASVTCFFTIQNYVPAPGEDLVNTVEVTGHQEGNPDNRVSDSDTSAVLSIEVLPVITPTPPTVPPGPLAVTGLDALTVVLMGLALMGLGKALTRRRKDRRDSAETAWFGS